MVESGVSRFQSSLVPAQIAALNTAITSNTSSLNQLLESVAVAGVISSIGYPANQDMTASGSNPMVAATPFKVGASLTQKPADALPIASLSDMAIGYPIVSQGEMSSPVFNLGQKLLSTQTTGPETNFIDLSLVPLGTPVAITQLSDAQSRVTVIDGNATTVRIADFKLAPGLPEMFINTNLATLNLAVPSTSLSTLSTAERIDFKVTGIEISAGITVSGTADAPNTTLLLAGDRANAQAVSTSLSSLTSPSMAAEINALAVNFGGEFTPLFLAELSSIPAGELQIRLVGTVAVTETDILPGTLILGG
jgi:hypothetical protein